MKKEIGDLTLSQIVDMCDNECDDCWLWHLCKALDWNIFRLAFNNADILKERIEVKDDA